MTLTRLAGSWQAADSPASRWPTLTFNARDLFAELRGGRLLPTGCSSIDAELLRGGLREGHLIEICGEPASGKTQLCLTAAAQTLLRGERVAWIDTGASFSAARLIDVLCALRPPLQADHAQLEAALDRVVVAPARDVHAVLDVLGGLLASGDAIAAAIKPLPPQNPRLGLVVLDALPGIAGPLLGVARQAQGPALLARLAAALRALAAARRVPVLAANGWVGSGGGGGGGRPALSEAWRAAPHARLRLRLRLGDAGRCGGVAVPGCRRHEAALLGSSHAPPAAGAGFVIGAAGVAAAR
ncbi:RAD51D [Auxenochlorella protothecoides x Auxenochlorella symbiontica]